MNDELNSQAPTHGELVSKAKAWLRSHKRCNPVFTGHASCCEVPDAIGWSARGSVLIECKVSISDLRADGKKYLAWRDPATGYVMRRRGYSAKSLMAAGYIRQRLARMGDERWIMCPAGIITEDAVAKHAPGHGLLWLKGTRVQIVHRPEASHAV